MNISSKDHSSSDQEASETEHDITVDTVRLALQSKLDAEKRDGFHLGLIADGNRRWAHTHGQEGHQGHDEGAEVIEKVVLPLVVAIPQIKELSIYLLSHLNLSNRKPEELNNIYRLLQYKCGAFIEYAHSKNIRYKHAGEKNGLSAEAQEVLSRLEKETSHNSGVTVNLCINYDAKLETGHAIKDLISASRAEVLEQMTPLELIDAVQKRSWIPTPADAVIRTGGDARFSGFLGNRAYDVDCHLFLEEKFLPEITAQDVLRHLLDFALGERRMGK